MKDHPVRTDALIAASIAVAVLIVTPGLVIAAIVGLVVLALLAVTAAVERRRSQARARARRQRARPRPVHGAPSGRALGSGRDDEAPLSRARRRQVG